MADAFRLSSGISAGTLALIEGIVTAKSAAALAERSALPIALAPMAAEAIRPSFAEALAESEASRPKLAAADADAEADAPTPAPPPAESASARLAAPAGIENEIGGKLRSASSLPNCELHTQGMVWSRLERT